ncbi:ABC-2 type transport system ATP-binding protein [Catenulispora sp. GAS73]|uniref:ABC transporter ATP-binding protein n=1 Tax=Catenulispora sp. GAS73 TaxID=3156269 RepID=UPI003513658A
MTIEACELTKRFGGAVAVDALSFTVRPGRVTGFLGPNGAGKSTTMRMILGLDAPDAGAAFVDGRPYGELQHPLREVGALLDANAVHPARSALAHLRVLAASNGLGTARIGEVLARTGLTEVARRRVGGFSLGMKQRLGLAAALLGDPPVLILDEPVNGLDPEGVHWMRGLLKELAAEGRTVFVSSHLLTEMALTADHLVIIGRGRLVAESSTAEFLAANSRTDVLVRASDPTALAAALRTATVSVEPDGALIVAGLEPAAIGDTAAAHGIGVHELTVRRASLEEAYLQATEGVVDFRDDQNRAGYPTGHLTEHPAEHLTEEGNHQR